MISDEDISKRVKDLFDFRLGWIVREFGLRRIPGSRPGGFYQRLASYGHMGRQDMDLPWELTDRADALKEG
jgi:S-adenosylmethionine synthetase